MKASLERANALVKEVEAEREESKAREAEHDKMEAKKRQAFIARIRDLHD